MRPERIEPAAGQESVWDYPRPPRLEKSEHRICVTFNGVVIADTRSAWRVLETSHPPVYYLSPAAFNSEQILRSARSSFCEWKGRAGYVDIRVGDRIARSAGWYYPDPAERFQAIRDHIALYPGAMDSCTLDGERVRPQPGGFYGGWITSRIVGPFKGEPGTDFW